VRGRRRRGGILQTERRRRETLLRRRRVNVVVVEALLDAAARRVGEVVVAAEIFRRKVVVVRRRRRKGVQRVAHVAVVVQARHVVAVHAQWGLPEGPVRVVPAEFGSAGRVGAVAETLRVPVEGDGVGGEAEAGVDHARREASHSRPSGVGGQEGGPGHEPHLVQPLLFAALVLEPDLDDPHGQAGFLGELFPHETRWLRRLVEDVLEDLELLGLDGGPRPPPLVLLVLLVAVGVVVVVGAVALRVVDVVLAVDDGETVAEVALDAGVAFR